MSKIIHTVPTISNEASGPSKSVIRLCESILVDELEVLTIGKSIENISKTFIKNFVYSLPPKKLGISSSMYRYLRTMAIRKNIKLIHNHGMWMLPNIYPGLISRKFNIPLVYSPRGSLSAWAMSHGSLIKKIFYPAVQFPVLEQVSLFHATAMSEYDEIRENNLFQPVTVIPNGIDIPVIKPKKRKEFKKLLFLSRIHPKKGIESLLKAWSNVYNNHPNWILDIVGPGKKKYVNKLKKIIEELKLERVRISGPLYGREKEVVYMDSDLFILPTHNENFGMVVAEALSYSLPVIVSKGAPWDQIEQNEAGWWVENNVSAYTRKIDDVLGLPQEELIRMGKNGRKWMEEDFSWGSVGEKMLTSYKWMENKSTYDKPNYIIL